MQHAIGNNNEISQEGTPAGEEPPLCATPRCQANCSSCAIHRFKHSDRTTPSNRRRAGLELERALMGIQMTTDGFTPTVSAQISAFREFSARIPLCHVLNGDAQIVKGIANHVHDLIQQELMIQIATQG